MARQTKTAGQIPEVEAAPRKSLFERVAGFLDANDWQYHADPDKACIDLRIRVKDASVRVFFDVFQADDWQRVLVFSIFPVYVPEYRRTAALDAINRINFVTVFGNLEMDMRDGEVRIRTLVEDDRELKEAMMERAFLSNLDLVNRYLAGMLAVAFGNVDPSTILDLVPPAERTHCQ